jgi:hypothetical protein
MIPAATAALEVGLPLRLMTLAAGAAWLSLR